MKAEPEAVLLDGIFLASAARQFWNYTIFVKAEFDMTLRRALLRDLHFLRQKGYLPDSE
jgi:uridine kinase